MNPKTLVVGLGNPILGDDGVGWRVVETAAAHAPSSPHIEFDCVALGGLSLMERLIGYERAIIVDALASADGRPGEIITLPLADLPDHSAGHLTAVHDTSLPTALALGRQMGADLPQKIIIVGISTHPTFDFSERLSPDVAAAVPGAVTAVLELISSSY